MSYSNEYRKNRAALMELKLPCYWCGTAWTPKFQADHLLEKDNGGGDEPSNLVSSCAPCNQARGQKYKTRKENARVLARNKAAGLPPVAATNTRATKTKPETVFDSDLSTPSKPRDF